MESSQSVRCYHTAKSTGRFLCFLLVNFNQPKSNLFDFFMLIKKRIAKILRVIIANARFDNFN